ncbi:hypothetical protein KRZ98_03920 [Sphingobium sp. AS12]|uniref:hypothetical protein n=1 Tax=Sphingobium sp. AS12 TaxID=2849495 RepID=UPI001C318A06|nr:hypothetical protein [Sphingobium sp. AS12]MBV2147433.1 hypothetical protein [Sphingobium sp. AS12]
MSSITVIQQNDAVHLITDAAHYDLDGVILSIRSKICELPRSGCVFATRGSDWSMQFLEWMLSRCDSFDEIVKVLPGVMSVIDTGFLTFASDMPAKMRHYVITIAGWSESAQRVTTVMACTYPIGDPADTEGWSMNDFYGQYTPIYVPIVMTIPPVSLEGALGRTVDDTTDWVDAMDPAADGLAIFEEQRRFVSTYIDSVQYVVGGFAELTTITRDGITRSILKEYPDQVGELITPDGAMPIAEAWESELASRRANMETAEAA